MKAYVIYGQEFDRQEARWTRIPAALLVEQVELTQEEFDRIEAKEVERKRRLQEDARRRAWRR